jgi:hypothetical protein
MAEGGRRPDEGRGENLNNQVAEILSRSRKVRTQISKKTNFVTAHDGGAKGQRPCKAGPGPDWPVLPKLGWTQSRLARKEPLRRRNSAFPDVVKKGG